MAFLIGFTTIMVIITVVAFYYFFKMMFAPNTSSKVDPHLKMIAQKILKKHLKSMESGELISKENLSQEIIPELTKYYLDFKSFRTKGVQVISQAQNFDKLHLRVLSDNEKQIKIELTGLFKLEYLHNGKLIINPDNPESYADQNTTSEFDNASFTLTFKKSNNGEFILSGISDTIMGNSIG